MSLDREHGIHCISINSGPGIITHINETTLYQWKGWYLTKLVGEAVPSGKGQFSLTVSDVRVVLIMELGPHGLILLSVDIKHLNKSVKNLSYISPDTLQVEVDQDSSQGHCHIHQAPQHGPTPAHTTHPGSLCLVTIWLQYKRGFDTSQQTLISSPCWLSQPVVSPSLAAEVEIMQYKMYRMYTDSSSAPDSTALADVMQLMIRSPELKTGSKLIKLLLNISNVSSLYCNVNIRQVTSESNQLVS